MHVQDHLASHFLCWILGVVHLIGTYWGLSQAEKKITVVTSWATDKMTTIFSQNDNFNNFEWNSHFLHFLSLQKHSFSSQLEIVKSRVKWDNSQNPTQKMRTLLDQGFRCNKRCKCNFLVCMFAYHKHFQCTYIT